MFLCVYGTDAVYEALTCTFLRCLCTRMAAGVEKIRKLVSLLFGLLDGGFVFKEGDQKEVGPMWKLTWTVIIEVVEL